jgi:hypothetical protein
LIPTYYYGEDFLLYLFISQDREFVDMDLPFNGVGLTKKKGGGGGGGGGVGGAVGVSGPSGSRAPSPTHSEQTVSCFACRCCRGTNTADKNMVSVLYTINQ